MNNTFISAIGAGDANIRLLFQENTGAIRRVDRFSKPNSWQAPAGLRLQLDVVARNNTPLVICYVSKVSTLSLSHNSNALELHSGLTDL